MRSFPPIARRFCSLGACRGQNGNRMCEDMGTVKVKMHYVVQQKNEESENDISTGTLN